jgi:hypothetical protein
MILKKMMFAWAVLALLGAAESRGQLQASLTLDHRRYAKFEPVLATLAVFNHADIPVIIDPRNGMVNARVVFAVERDGSQPVPYLQKGDAVTRLRVMPNEKQQVQVQLGDWFNMSGVGDYTITAAVEFEGQTAVTPSVNCSVDNGFVLKSIERPLFSAAGESRRYSVRYLARDRGEYAFFRVEDPASEECYGTFALGPVLRGAVPVIEATGDGKVTVVHRSDINAMTRSSFVIEPDKAKFVNQTYHQLNGKETGPKAEKEKTGNSSVDAKTGV